MATRFFDGFVYLAAPFSHPDKKVREERVDKIFKATVYLMDMGYNVFSPIVHTYQLEDMVQKSSHEFWLKQDIAILRHASALILLELDGWKESKGVQRELDIANACQIPVIVLNEKDVF